MDTNRKMTSVTRWFSLLFLMLGLCVTAEVHAQEPSKAKKELDPDNPDKFKMKQIQLKQQSGFDLEPPFPARSFLDVNNATVTIEDDGKYAFADPFSGSNGSFPRATGGNTTFAQGFMFAGKVKDGLTTEVRSGGSTYFTGMKPGGVDPQTGEPEDQTNAERFHVWRVHRDWEDPTVQQRSAAYRAGIANPSEVGEAAVAETRAQYNYDWFNWPADDGAPFQDCNNDGQYTPAPPEAVDSGTDCEDLREALDNGEIEPGPDEGIDIPGRRADQTLWTVANDMGSASLDNDISSVYGSPEIGVEVQYTVWGYDRPPGAALGNIAFHNAKLTYTGKPDAHPNPTPPDAQIDSMFISWWVDPDIGTFSNDFVGVDTTSSLAFAYNAGPNDATFESLGLPPPAVGFDFLKGPVLAADRTPSPQGDTLGLTSFSFFAAGTTATDPALFDYTGTLEWFNLMRGVLPQPEWPQAEPFINPFTGEPDVFTNSGDPVTGRGWIDGEFVGPSDRRMAPNTGPFKMEVGDTVDVTVAQVKGIGSGALSSVSIVRFFDEAAQFTFDQDFQVPTPPAAPAATATGLDEQVVLRWGDNEDRIQQVEEKFTSPPGFEFQGYRVYQLPSRGAALSDGERIATFDEDDGVRQLVDNVFNEGTGTIEQQTVQLLQDTGIQRHLIVDRDAIRQAPISNGNDLFFAVTSFGFLEEEGTGVPSRVLESSPQRFTVRPQESPPELTDLPEVGQIPEVTFTGDGDSGTEVLVEVVDPTAVETTDYTITTGSSWNLERGGEELVSGIDFGESRVVDGLLVEVRDTSSAMVNPNTDSWTFSTEGAQQASDEELKERIGDIGVFPNPYRGFNRLENSRFDKFVRFTNLPSPEKGTTTIRIFTLSGNPVRVIRHDSGSPNPNFEDWDLRNQNDTFVASGIYLIHMNTPVGDKTLRLAMVMEDEVLPNF